MLDVLRKDGKRAAARFGFDEARLHALRNVLQCRTAALGGHAEVCTRCIAVHPAYNSCRNRHCPQCQGSRRAEWAAAEAERLLPAPHFMVVFTLPGALRPLASNNPALVYDILLRAAADTLAHLARRKYDATLGVTSVLHTWTREMSYHPHVHCIVSAAGLRTDQAAAIQITRDWLFRVQFLANEFRKRVIDALAQANARGELACGRWAWSTWRQKAGQKPWVAHVEPPEGRDRQQVVRYLARYVYNIAISDKRIVAATTTTVTIATRNGKTLQLPRHEFVRRWSLHVLPKGFRKVRHTGLYASSARTLRALTTSLLGAAALGPPPAKPATPTAKPELPLLLRTCGSCGAPVLRVPLAQLATALQVLRTTTTRARGPP